MSALALFFLCAVIGAIATAMFTGTGELVARLRREEGE